MTHLEILYPPQNKAYHIFEQHPDFLKKHQFILGGGTALALQIGHRRSVDFDFFSPRSFDPKILLKEAMRIFPDPELQQEGNNTLSFLWKKTKLSFFGGITLHFLKTPVLCSAFSMFNVLDIATMKMAAVLQRTALRDYFDLAFLLKTKAIVLPELISGFYEKYGQQGKTYPQHFLLKTLSYVHDLPDDPVEILLETRYWKGKAIRKRIEELMEETINEYLKSY